MLGGDYLVSRAWASSTLLCMAASTSLRTPVWSMWFCACVPSLRRDRPGGHSGRLEDAGEAGTCRRSLYGGVLGQAVELSGGCAGGGFLMGAALDLTQIRDRRDELGEVSDQHGQRRRAAACRAEHGQQSRRRAERVTVGGWPRGGAVGFPCRAVEGIGGLLQVAAGPAGDGQGAAAERVGGGLGEFGRRSLVDAAAELGGCAAGHADDVVPQGAALARVDGRTDGLAACAVPAAAEPRQGQVGGEPAAAVPEGFAVRVLMAGEADRISGDLARVLVAVPVPDKDPGTGQA